MSKLKKIQKEFPLYPHIDFDLTVCSHLLPIGLSSTYPEDFIRRVAAAGVSHLMRLSSMDYTLKRYLKNTTYDLPEQRLDRELTALIQEFTSYVSESLKGFEKPRRGKIGLMIADVNLMRFPITVQAITTLAHRGMLFEPIAILRNGIEQLAWIYAVHEMTDIEKIMALSASRCMSGLKKVYPTAGRIYGHLSRYAHWDPELHHNFVGDHEGYIASIKAQCGFKARSLFFAVLISEMCVAVFENIYRERNLKMRFYDRKSANCVMRERKTLTLLNEVHERFKANTFMKEIIDLFP